MNAAQLTLEGAAINTEEEVPLRHEEALTQMCSGGCGLEKPLTQFHRDATRPTGFGTRCKSCEINRYRERMGRRPLPVSKPAPVKPRRRPLSRPTREGQELSKRREAMKAFPFTLGRAWLEYKGLDHLLPDPHSHGHIYNAVNAYYHGGAEKFVTDTEGGQL